MKLLDFTLRTRRQVGANGGDNPLRWQDRTSNAIFAGRTVVLFALPGTFAIICSGLQLPGYEERYDEFKALGVGEVVCLSLSDAFTLQKWVQHLWIEKLTPLPDDTGRYTHVMGMLVDKGSYRCWRYFLLTVDGEIDKLFVELGYTDNEPSDPFVVSDAMTMLDYLVERKGKAAS